MIECKVIYQFENGGSSDSLNQIHQLNILPNVGDTLMFVGGDGEPSKTKVKDIVHLINPTTKKHEIEIYHS